MATSPIVPAQLLLGGAAPDSVTCDQLVDLFWFYGNAHQAVGAHAAQDVKLMGAPNLQESPALLMKGSSLHYDRNGRSLRNPHEDVAAFVCSSSLGGSKNGSEHPSQDTDGHLHHQCKNIDIAHQCSQLAASVKWLRKVFDTFDENKDGLLSLEELRRSFGKLGLESSNVHILLRHCSGQEGLVSQDDFLLLYHGVSCRHCGPPQVSNHPHNIAETMSSNGDDAEEANLILEAFNVFDKDGDGFISPTELQSVLCSLGFGAARELNACIDMIKEYDRDGNGQVDFEEFKDMLNSAIKQS